VDSIKGDVKSSGLCGQEGCMHMEQCRMTVRRTTR